MLSLTRTGVAIGLAFFLYRPSMDILAEYTPLFLKQIGYNAGYIGLTPVLGLVTQTLGMPLLGWVADRFRARKLILFLSVLISIPSTLLFLVVRAPKPVCEISMGNWTGENNGRYTKFNINLSSEARPTEFVLKNNPHVDNDQGRLVFFLIFMLLRGTFELCKRLTITLITVAAVTYLKNDRAKFGYYACWGEIGCGVCLFVVGFSLSHLKHSVCGELTPHYLIVYFFAVSLQVLTLGTLPWLNFEYLEHRVIDYGEVKSVLTKPHYILILVICFHCGLCTTFQIRWEFWYMEKLGGSSVVMAVGGFLRRVSVAVWFLKSRRVINLLGELNVMAISLFIFAASFAAMAFVENAWLVIVFDICQAAALVLSFSSFLIHFSKASSKASTGFFQGTVSLTFHGIGREIGSAITGWLFTSQGTRITLCGYSVVTALLLIIFLIYLTTAKLEDLDAYRKLPTSDTGKVNTQKCD